MDWLDALIMGIVQGLAEYLPISSSGHLEIFNKILGLNLQPDAAMSFDLALHVATVLSTVVILWHEFFPLCRSFFTFRRDNDFWTVCKILVSCIPVGVVGLCFKDAIEGFFGGQLLTVGICLIVTAVLLSLTYLNQRRETLGRYQTTTRDISWRDAFIIGCAQAVAVLPGLSRSGTTIATGLLLGNNREKVAHFSFLMVIIPILGEGLLDIKDMISGEAATTTEVGFLPLLVGFMAAFIVGCIACKWMLNIVKKGKLIWFAVYCAIVGLVCVCW